MATNYDKVSFYAVAHADDWQLFMQPNVLQDLKQANTKTVFLVITAGDAGRDPSHWIAREAGMMASIRLLFASIADVVETTKMRFIGSHSVICKTVNDVITYFLRLPDGGLNGTGFVSNRFCCIEQLILNPDLALATVDGSATYNNLDDLLTTMRLIIDEEMAGSSGCIVHCHDPESATNPSDHPDHIACGSMMTQLAKTLNIPHRVYTGYSNKAGESLQDAEDLFWKTAMLSAYEKAVYDLTGYSTFREDRHLYVAWCTCRSKSRIFPVDPADERSQDIFSTHLKTHEAGVTHICKK